MNVQWMGFAVAFVAGVPLLLPAQAPDLTGLAHVALRVSDVDREVAFLGKLGFEQAFKNVENGRTVEAFIKVNDRQFIEVYPPAAAGEPAQPLGMMHACYETADLQALSARYEAAGLKPTPLRKAGAGNLLFNLQDPDGRVTEFTQYMPGSRQMNDLGEHLGDQRVSDELLGFVMPVRDMEVAQKFYEAMGFNGTQNGANLRLTARANSDLHIELHPTRDGNDRPELLFSVVNARRTADQLQSAGLTVERDQKLVIVRDPEGNTFVLMEAGESGPWRYVPREQSNKELKSDAKR